jgi:D-arabinose 1-dehydrogenase-like Zn-dependent alcohol dehydrogenase
MAKMKAAQNTKAGGDFDIVELEIPQPGRGQVRIRVQACGVCHSEVFVKEGGWPGLEYPRVPGHEIAGVIDAVGSGVTHSPLPDRGEAQRLRGPRPLGPRVGRQGVSRAPHQAGQ